LPLLLLPNIKLANKRRYRQVFACYTQNPTVGYVDCYHAALIAGHLPTPELYSYDTDFDAIRLPEGLPAIARREPPMAEPDEAQAA
jgi:predicted nucleic acid-binding protein